MSNLYLKHPTLGLIPVGGGGGGEHVLEGDATNPPAELVEGQLLYDPNRVGPEDSGLFLPLAGGTMTGPIVLPASDGSVVPLHWPDGMGLTQVENLSGNIDGVNELRFYDADGSVMFRMFTDSSESTNVINAFDSIGIFSNGYNASGVSGEAVELDGVNSRLNFYMNGLQNLRIEDQSGSTRFYSNNERLDLWSQNGRCRVQMYANDATHPGRFRIQQNADDIFDLRTGTSQTFIPYIWSNSGSGDAVHVLGSGGQIARSTSSLRFKTDVEPISDPVTTIMALRPIFYRSMLPADESKTFYGFGAEDVAAVDRRLATYDQDETDDDGNPLSLTERAPQGLNDRALLANAIAVIQQQQERINDLEQRLTALEAV